MCLISDCGASAKIIFILQKQELIAVGHSRTILFLLKNTYKYKMLDVLVACILNIFTYLTNSWQEYI